MSLLGSRDTSLHSSVIDTYCSRSEHQRHVSLWHFHGWLQRCICSLCKAPALTGTCSCGGFPFLTRQQKVEQSRDRTMELHIMRAESLITWTGDRLIPGFTVWREFCIYFCRIFLQNGQRYITWILIISRKKTSVIRFVFSYPFLQECVVRTEIDELAECKCRITICWTFSRKICANVGVIIFDAVLTVEFWFLRFCISNVPFALIADLSMVALAIFKVCTHWKRETKGETIPVWNSIQIHTKRDE